MNGFIGGKVWAELTPLVRSCRHRRRVAVAYLGAEAHRQLPLRKGDVLVVAATPANAEAGAINPESLKFYFDKGVQLRRHDSLHAKVLRLGPVTVVGSANASPTSARLEEAVTVSRSKAMAADADVFIDALIANSVPIDDVLIDGLQKAWDRRTRCGAPGVAAPVKELAWPRVDQRIFLIRSHEADLTAAQKAVIDKSARGLRRRTGSKEQWRLDTDYVPRRTDADRLHPGDILIFNHDDEDGNQAIYPPAEVLTDPLPVPHTRSAVVPLKVLTDLEEIDFDEAQTKFRQTAKAPIGRERLVSDPRHVKAFLGLFGLPRTTS